jgi:hypothetical protein
MVTWNCTEPLTRGGEPPHTTHTFGMKPKASSDENVRGHRLKVRCGTISCGAAPQSPVHLNAESGSSWVYWESRKRPRVDARSGRRRVPEDADRPPGRREGRSLSMPTATGIDEVCSSAPRPQSSSPKLRFSRSRVRTGVRVRLPPPAPRCTRQEPCPREVRDTTGVNFWLVPSSNSRGRATSRTCSGPADPRSWRRCSPSFAKPGGHTGRNRCQGKMVRLRHASARASSMAGRVRRRSRNQDRADPGR